MESSPSMPRKTLIGSIVVRMIFAWTMIPTLFFLSAGTMAWPEAVLYSFVMMSCMTAFIIIFLRRDPALIERRMRMRERESRQRGIMLIGIPLFLAAFTLPGIGHRLGWPELGFPVAILGDVGAILGYALFFLVMRENSWAGRTIAVEKGQTVISTGPYALVRHPMYVAALIIYFSTPIALGSAVSLVAVIPIVGIIVARIVAEEKTLVRDLPGYEEYRKKVRFRLLPFIW